jgi:hypothetical protein
LNTIAGVSKRRAGGLHADEADDEEPLPAKAHCEMWVVGIVRNARIALLAEPFVLVAERLKAAPQPLFETLLVCRRASLEQHD